MLVLSRRIGETITLGGDAATTFTILDVNGTQVKVGIKAPRSLAVHRLEVYKRIQQAPRQHLNQPN